MSNGLEIERRFIMRAVPSMAADETYIIFQKYAASGWRYRQRISGREVVYYKTRKTAISSGVNNEEEYEISEHEFTNECGIVTKGIHKTRHVYEHEGLRFEVDQFHHISLVIMEIELDDIAQEFTMPAFLKELIIMEVTGVKELSNSSLAAAQYV